MFHVSVEDTQTILFPFILIPIYIINSNKDLRIPNWILLIAGLLWLSGAVGVRDILPFSHKESAIYLSRIDEDPNGYKARNILRLYNELEKLYSVPEMTLLQRNITNFSDAKYWLDKHGSVKSLILGTSEWLEIILSNKISFFNKSLNKKTEFPSYFLAELKKNKLNLNSGLHILQSQDLKVPLLIVETPEYISLPVNPPNLSRHYLAWLSQALEEEDSIKNPRTNLDLILPAHPEENSENLRAFREHFLQLAIDVDGQWKTLEPRAAAYFFKGVLSIASGEETKKGKGSFRCAYSDFKHALSNIRSKDAPALYSAASNNAAVVSMLLSNRKAHIFKAYNLLLKAAATTNKNGTPTKAAKAALVNILMFRKVGLL